MVLAFCYRRRARLLSSAELRTKNAAASFFRYERKKKSLLADKYLVKDYVRDLVGDEYVVPTLGVWDRFDDIDFDALPDSFVLKANHGSGYNYFVPDKSKLDRADAKKKFDRWLGINYGALLSCEIHYRAIKPVIIAEPYISSSDGRGLLDYKTICIKGSPEVYHIIGGRSEGKVWQNIYDRNLQLWEQKGCIYPLSQEDDLIPSNIDEMILLIKKLCAGIDYVRVDLYNVDGHIYFGEYTFVPAGFSHGTVLTASNWDRLGDEAKDFIYSGPSHGLGEKFYE